MDPILPVQTREPPATPPERLKPCLDWIPQILWSTHRLTGIDPRDPDHLAVTPLAAARTTTTKPFGVLALEIGLPTTTANTVGAT